MFVRTAYVCAHNDDFGAKIAKNLELCESTVVFFVKNTNISDFICIFARSIQEKIYNEYRDVKSTE
jgi:hypothetical protein